MPYLKEDKVGNDPVATDLVGALVAVRTILFFRIFSFLFHFIFGGNIILECSFLPSVSDNFFYYLFQQSPRTTWESRRSSVDSQRIANIKAIVNSRIQMKHIHGPQEISELLNKSLDWDFDIFKLELLTENR